MYGKMNLAYCDMKFNQQQQKIIDSIFGAFLVSAPVGTGKTTVLTERVVMAMEEGIRPEEILCLTFTNRAAEEMTERIKKRINKKKVMDKIGEKYLEELKMQNALDFNNLVLITMEGLYRDKKLQKKWSKRFRFIQLDEFQDTHLSEYLVVKELAKIHKSFWRV